MWLRFRACSRVFERHRLLCRQRRPDRLIFFICLSVLLHGGMVSLLISFRTVGLIAPTSGTEDRNGVEIDELTVSSGGDTGNGEDHAAKPRQTMLRGRPDTHGEGDDLSEAGQQGQGASGHPNSAHSILSEIRAKIERAKRYPEAARRMKLGGRAVVRFRIDDHGGLIRPEILQSSGSELLDQAALDTLQRAVPLPLYPQTLSIALRFEP